MRRAIRAAVVAATIAVVAAPSPASAAAPFGSGRRATPNGCHGSKTVTDSGDVTRGFVTCSNVVRFVRGRGTTWTTATTPYAGRVLAVADDGASVYGLLNTSSGVRVIKRTYSGSHSTKLVSSRSAEGFGGAIAARNGKWWAVWSERHPDNDMWRDLYQARTMGATQGPTRIQTGAWNISPTLILRPGAPGVLMAWRREATMTIGDVWLGVNSGGGWSYRKLVPDADAPTLAASGSTVLLAYLTRTRGGCPCPVGFKRRRDGVWGGTKVFSTPGLGRPPLITASRGRVFVGWTRRLTNGEFRSVAVQSGQGWGTVSNISSAQEVLSSLTAYNGKAIAILKRGDHALAFDVARRQ